MLEAVWERINLMGRWKDTAAWGEDQKDDEELMWRYGEHRYLLHQLKNGLSLHLFSSRQPLDLKPVPGAEGSYHQGPWSCSGILLEKQHGGLPASAQCKTPWRA